MPRRELKLDPAAQDYSSLDVWAPVRRFLQTCKARHAAVALACGMDFDIGGGRVEDNSDGYEVLAPFTRVFNQPIRNMIH